jgi:hypothetical protein
MTAPVPRRRFSRCIRNAETIRKLASSALERPPFSTKCSRTARVSALLSNRQGQRLAVIVNDMSEVNIDAELVRQDGGLTRTDER